MLFLITKGSEAMEKILGTFAGILTGIIAGWAKLWAENAVQYNKNCGKIRDECL